MAFSLLRLGLLTCVAYFSLMSLAHWTGHKAPGLFVYWNVPSYEYQDKIIAFCAATYAVFFFHAANNPEAVPAALLSLALTVLGLAGINSSSDLRQAIGPKGSTAPYWGLTGGIAVLGLVLGFLYWEEERSAAARRVARKRK